MSERDALLAAVLADPDDDTIRLAFADWLDEHDDADRAEFIRLQVEVEHYPKTLVQPHTERRPQLLTRGDALQAAHPEWWRVVCPRCEGDGKAHGSDRPGEWSPDPSYMTCPVCGGTGDLLRASARGDKMRDPVHHHQFRRGFLDSVECRLDEVARNKGSPPIRLPVPWARALVRAVPTLTRIRLTDRVPHRFPGTFGVGWLVDGGGVPESGVLPTPLFNTVICEHGNSWDDHDAADDALARAVCRWVRGQAGKA